MFVHIKVCWLIIDIFEAYHMTHWQWLELRILLTFIYSGKVLWKATTLFQERSHSQLPGSCPVQPQSYVLTYLCAVKPHRAVGVAVVSWSSSRLDDMTSENQALHYFWQATEVNTQLTISAKSVDLKASPHLANGPTDSLLCIQSVNLIQSMHLKPLWSATTLLPTSTPTPSLYFASDSINVVSAWSVLYLGAFAA